MVVIAWWLDLQLPVQSVHITTKIVSSKPIHGEVYLLLLNVIDPQVLLDKHVIKFVNDLRQVSDFLHVLQFSPPITLTATI